MKARTAPPSTSGPFQPYDHKTAAINSLLEEKRAALPPIWESARAFYGEDPVNKTTVDFLRIATREGGFPDPKQTWFVSYKAAFEARLLTRSIDVLTARANKVAVERVKAQARLHQSADQRLTEQAQGVELAQVRLDEARFQHHVDLREMEERLEHFSRHQQDGVTQETAALHAKDLAEEINALLMARHAARSSRAEAEIQAQKLDIERNFLHRRLTSGNPESASEQNRVDREALLQTVVHTLDAHQESWPEEQQRMATYEAQIERALVDARSELVRLAALGGTEPSQRPATYALTVASLGAPQVMTPKASSMAAFESVRPALAKALLSAGRRVGGLPRAGLYFAALVVFSLKLEEGGRHGLSVPLTSMKLDFDPQQLLEGMGEHLALPMRLISGLVGDDSTIRIIPTSNDGVSADVPVRAATWDAEKGAYTFITEGPGPITILWTPGAPPTDSSTSLPVVQQPVSPLYPGDISLDHVPPFLPFPAEDDVHFDDYIITFPADSGLEPVYVMFKDPRDYAGVGAGSGQTIPGWRDAMTSPEGAPIPTQIADQLRGKQFSRWGKLREAIWKAAAADPELSKSFPEISLDNMRKGKAPYASSGQVGKHLTFELHHIHPIAKGGAVYDLDNLAIMTPRAHQDAHKGKN
ncbi:S-type pyocin domain-containing protein [Pseudomonas sp. Marseille-P9899]|uniref:S-type pyocin domain-containing protein n=1 Tax=Pseudomonas sp. Marseille-P9899 TaxID=2730401 RepID=UPI00158A5765|nr:S-type pyocin domain-containing protein [Pseudomonas sp. Marseille-P9899]